MNRRHRSFQEHPSSFLLTTLIDITPWQIVGLQLAVVVSGYRSIDLMLAGRAFETHTDEENFILTLEGSGKLSSMIICNRRNHHQHVARSEIL